MFLLLNETVLLPAFCTGRIQIMLKCIAHIFMNPSCVRMSECRGCDGWSCRFGCYSCWLFVVQLLSFQIFSVCMPLAICQWQRNKYKSVTKILIFVVKRVCIKYKCVCVCISHHFHLLCSYLMRIFRVWFFSVGVLFWFHWHVRMCVCVCKCVFLHRIAHINQFYAHATARNQTLIQVRWMLFE